MAARTNRPHHNDKSREAIQTTQLVKRLQDHVVKETELSKTQIKAIEILLKKTLPDLSSIELSGEVDQKHFVIAAPGTIPETTWQAEHGKDDQGNPEE